jgi:hypothetical protein
MIHDMDTFFFQQRVHRWLKACLGIVSASDEQERNLRFFEEAAELVLVRNMTREKMHEVIDYVCDREAAKGAMDSSTPGQEVAGTVVTLAALCNQAGITISEVAYEELQRIETPEVMQRVRDRQKTKPSAVRSPTHGEGVLT